MKKLYLEDMELDQLLVVWERNNLVEEVRDDMIDTEMMFIEDQMEEIKDSLVSWSIGVCNRDQHITVDGDKLYEFMYGMESLINDYGVSNGVMNTFYTNKNKIDKLLEERDNESRHDYYDESDYYDRIADIEEEWFDAAQEVADELCNYYTKALDEGCYDSENLYNHFIDFYIENRMDYDEIYVLIDDEGSSDWHIKQDISYTKSWA